MKSKNITTLILEGADGVGKSTITLKLFKIYNYRYMVYHRGEMSNLLFALKYNRNFTPTQVSLPFLHILLTCDKDELRRRITQRETALNHSKEEMEAELAKVNDQDKFIELAGKMSQKYHIIVVDTTGKTADETAAEVAKKVDEYVANLEIDANVSEWNAMYKKACDKLGLAFTVRDNQPYINDIMFMSEFNLQNGVYEMFGNKDYPDNFIYSLAYDDVSPVKVDEKDVDFAYIINSKIKDRREIFDYYSAFCNADKTCLTSSYELIPDDPHLIKTGRAFGNDFINMISEAKATVYCARDLEFAKLQTARIYEATLADQILFVDKLSDTGCEMLKAVHKDDEKLIELLYVTPENIVSNYDYVMSHKDLYDKILSNQHSYYEWLKESVGAGKFKKGE